MASARCLLLLLLVVAGGQAAKKRKISSWHLKVGQEQGYVSFFIIFLAPKIFLAHLTRKINLHEKYKNKYLGIQLKKTTTITNASRRFT